MLPVYENEDPASNAVAKKIGRQIGRKLRRNLLDFKLFSTREWPSLAKILLIVGIVIFITVLGIIVLRQRAIAGFVDSAKLSAADKQSGRFGKQLEERHFPEEVPETKQEDVKREQAEELEPVRDKDEKRDGEDHFAGPGAPAEGVAKMNNQNEAEENVDEPETEKAQKEEHVVMEKLPKQKEEETEQEDQQENVEMELREKREEMPLKNSEEQEELEHAEENVEDLNTRRRNAVKEAFLHAWGGYKKHAFGHDEIRPTTNQTNDSWGGFGATLVDALDTMMVMNVERYLIDEAIAFVAGLDFNKDKKVSFFETTIRYVGGLLACYELSKHPTCLQKAKELTDRLMPAFDKTLGIPYHEVNLQTGKAGNPSWTGGASILSEVGSIQLEFKYLSHHTKDPKYAQAADKIFDLLKSKPKPYKGLYPLMIDVKSGDFVSDQVTFGALADSFYEYLLKRYLLGNKKDPKFREMYDESIDGLKQYLLDKSKPSGLVFISELNHGKQVHRFEHLTCFVPGMLTLGAMDESIPEAKRNEDIAIATEVLKTCMHLYFSSATGIAPDIVTYQSEHDKGSQNGEKDYIPERSTYLLRPETVESIFYMYRYTKDEKYRDLGWKIFESINKYCRTKSAFSGLVDVNEVPPKQNNSQQSFFFAETLKYFYLLFSPDDVLPLDKYIFTTEGHPLGVLPE